MIITGIGIPASVVVGAGCSLLIVSAPSGFDGIEGILFRPWGFRVWAPVRLVLESGVDGPKSWQRLVSPVVWR